jgi:hypothetical protein
MIEEQGYCRMAIMRRLLLMSYDTAGKAGRITECGH